MNDKSPVQAYFNIRRKTFSLRNQKTGRVDRHDNAFILRDARFVVSQAGRARVLAEGRKNVHATVRGMEIEASREDCDLFSIAVPVRYNPYQNETFVRLDTGEAVTGADLVFFGMNGTRPDVRAYNPH